MNTFIEITGFCLGIVIIICTCFVCGAKPKHILSFVANSIAGCTAIWIANTIFAPLGFHAGLSPFTAVCVGILGIPGAVAVVVMCFII